MRSQSTQIRRPGLADKVVLALALCIVFGLTLRFVIGAVAAEPANEHFQRTWNRTDDPVKLGHVSRTWMWGDGANTGEMIEEYAEGPNGQRTVQYFDKSRMEITDPAGDSSSPWFVTNGLLVVELVTGQLQLGDATFEQHSPAGVNVAGDEDDPTGPTYQTMAGLLAEPALPDNATITWRIDRAGNVTDDPAMAIYTVTAAQHVVVPGIDHQVAGPFWSFMNSSGSVYENGAYVTAPLFLDPFYATGYPITEAYWANVKVAGTYQDVLLQCFERRCLTYTPGNDPGWQVEAGNVGLHYYTWRYGQIGDDNDGTPTTEPPADATPTAGPGEPTETPGSPNDPGDPPDPTAPPTGTVEPTPTTEPTQETALSYQHSHQIGGPDGVTFGLGWPDQLASSPDGYIYATDSWDRILKFSTTGQLMATFGDELSVDFGGDLAADARGNLYHAGYKQISAFDNKGSLVRTWQALNCTAFAVDLTDLDVDPAGNIYVLAESIHRLFKFSSTGTLLDQWGDPDCKASPLDGRFNDPEHVAIDSVGNVYVVDRGNNRIQKFNAAGDFVEEWTRTDDLFSRVVSLAIDGNDVLFLAVDGASNCTICIHRFQSDGTFIDTWSSGGSGVGEFDTVLDLTIDSDGYVYLTDWTLNRILKLDGNANFVEEWADFRRGRFTEPTTGMALDADDNLYVVDDVYDRVQVFGPGGAYQRSFGDPGTGAGQLDGAIDVAAYGDFIYVLDRTGNRILKYDRDGTFVAQRTGPFNSPFGIETDINGNVYVADTGNHRILTFDQNGAPQGAVGGPGDGGGLLEGPRDLAIHGDRIYVADTENHLVQVFDRQGTFLFEWGGPGNADGQFDHPSDVDIDKDGYVYVADRGNHRIQKFTPDGTYLTQFGSEGIGADDLLYVWRVEVASNGDVYALDLQNRRVQVYSPVN